MGISWILKIRAASSTNMKFFAIASALVAAAYCEADADPYYAAYGYAGLPVAYAGLKSAPCVNAANVPVPCAAGYAAHGYPYAYGGLYGGYGLWGRKKREAEAEPEADALYGAYAAYPYAAHGLGYAAYGYAGIPNPVHAVAATPLGLTHSSNVGICTNYLGAAVPCGKKKREAEAEANADLGHAVAYTGVGAVHSSLVGVCTNYLGAQVP